METCFLCGENVTEPEYRVVAPVLGFPVHESFKECWGNLRKSAYLPFEANVLPLLAELDERELALDEGLVKQLTLAEEQGKLETLFEDTTYIDKLSSLLIRVFPVATDSELTVTESMIIPASTTREFRLRALALEIMHGWGTESMYLWWTSTQIIKAARTGKLPLEPQAYLKNATPVGYKHSHIRVPDELLVLLRSLRLSTHPEGILSLYNYFVHSLEISLEALELAERVDKNRITILRAQKIFKSKFEANNHLTDLGLAKTEITKYVVVPELENIQQPQQALVDSLQRSSLQNVVDRAKNLPTIKEGAKLKSIRITPQTKQLLEQTVRDTRIPMYRLITAFLIESL